MNIKRREGNGKGAPTTRNHYYTTCDRTQWPASRFPGGRRLRARHGRAHTCRASHAWPCGGMHSCTLQSFLFPPGLLHTFQTLGTTIILIDLCCCWSQTHRSFTGRPLPKIEHQSVSIPCPYIIGVSFLLSLVPRNQQIPHGRSGE